MKKVILTFFLTTFSSYLCTAIQRYEGSKRYSKVVKNVTYFHFLENWPKHVEYEKYINQSLSHFRLMKKVIVNTSRVLAFSSNYLAGIPIHVQSIQARLPLSFDRSPWILPKKLGFCLQNVWYAHQQIGLQAQFLNDSICNMYDQTKWVPCPSRTIVIQFKHISFVIISLSSVNS